VPRKSGSLPQRPSRKAAKECSPRREPWEKAGSKKSPSGANDSS